MKAWVEAARPATLPVAVAPVLVGAAAAHTVGRIDAAAIVAALIGALLLQIGANLANDVYDAELGADNSARLGPRRAVASGLLGARTVKRAMMLVFALAIAVGAWLAVRSGWQVVAIGVASILAAVAYTAPPLSLGYRGLGDVCVLLFFGAAGVCGTSLVAVHHVPPLAVLAAFPVGALATAVLVINNLRDRGTDGPAGKRTLAVRFGRGFAVAELAGLVALAHLAAPLAVLLGLARAPALLALGTLPWGIRLALSVARSDGRALNPLLGAAARLLLAHAALLALGLWL
jgi:1,4-dihydroxy-2-naphthoate octaprenyltransferase